MGELPTDLVGGPVLCSKRKGCGRGRNLGGRAEGKKPKPSAQAGGLLFDSSAYKPKQKERQKERQTRGRGRGTQEKRQKGTRGRARA